MTAREVLFSSPRLHFFTGKGGVGKTSIVCAYAIAAAAQGRRPLIVELAGQHAVGALFATKLGSAPRHVGQGVAAMTIDLDVAAETLVQARVGMGKLARLDVVRRFFRAAPAVAELLTLDQLGRLESEMLDGSSSASPASPAPKWDPILIDLDATGHAEMFLSIADVFDGLVSSGPLRGMLDSFTALLTDPKRSILHLVTQPLWLPAQETAELLSTLRQRHRIALGALVLNQMPQRRFSLEDEEQLQQLQPSLPVEVNLARRHLADLERAGQVMRFLEELAMPLCVVPEFDTDVIPQLVAEWSGA